MVNPTKTSKSPLAVAKSQLGVSEQPPGSNKGPQVDQYLGLLAFTSQLRGALHSQFGAISRREFQFQRPAAF